jgi:hypothetical protein
MEDTWRFEDNIPQNRGYGRLQLGLEKIAGIMPSSEFPYIYKIPFWRRERSAKSRAGAAVRTSGISTSNEVPRAKTSQLHRL